jgi:hypothetical protein
MVDRQRPGLRLPLLRSLRTGATFRGSGHAALRATTTRWTRSKVQLKPARVSLWIFWRPDARMQMHAGYHPALSGQDQRTAARPYRYPD